MIDKLLNIFTESTLSFEGQQDGEIVVMILRRHRFTILAPLSFLSLAALFPPVLSEAFSEQFKALGVTEIFWFAASLWYLFLWLSIFYFITMYLLNTVIVTDRRIIESEQHGFFNRKISELHAYRVQDVSVHTHGFIETLLKFGDIVVQTAASEKQFVFHKIPNPEIVKDKIMEVVTAHQSKVKLA